MNTQNNFKPLIALCGIIFLDGVGLGIIFPLLAPLFFDPTHSILALNTSHAMRSLLYGVALSVFPLGIIFSAPMLGDLSDGYGRKHILLFSVIGVGFAYFLSGLAISFHWLWLLLLSRLVAGLLSGSQPIAQAAVMDVSTDETKARNLSFVFSFASLGFVVGPVLGGWLSNEAWCRYFHASTPLYVSAVFSFACAYFLKFFNETNTQVRNVEFRPLRGITVLIEAWQRIDIRMILFILFFYQTAWSGFFQIIPAYLHQRFGMSAHLLGYYSSLIAMGFGAAFLGGIHWLSQRIAAKHLILSAFVAICFCILLSLFIPTETIMWLITVPSGFFVAVIYVLLTTAGSSKAGEQFQGWFMGATMSVSAVAWFISPLITSSLLLVFLAAPILFCLLCYGIAGWMYKRETGGRRWN